MSDSNEAYANFYQVGYPVYVVSKIFGFLPFTIQYNAKLKINRVFVSFKDGLRLCLAIIVYAVCIFAMFWDKLEVKHNSLLIVYGIRLTSSGVLISAIFSAVTQLFNRKQIAFILREINQIDEEVICFIQ